MCSSKFVDPPNAAWTTIALRIAASVTMSFVVNPRFSNSTTARAERVAMSVQTGSPDGASAECGKDNPNASPTTCAVAAVPRNWHPPPGEAQARQPASAASCNDISPCENRAPIVCTTAVSSPSSGGRVTPPGTRIVGRSRIPASAIIIAGSPLSQVATPTTPERVGSERINLRKMVAASLR